MVEYQLFLHAMPHILFAHRYDTQHYRFRLPVNLRQFEITYVLQGGCDITTLLPDQWETPVHVPPDSVIFTVFDRARLYAAEGWHQHTTVGCYYAHPISKLSEADTAAVGGLILPQVLSFPTPENPVRPLVEQLVLTYNLDNAAPLATALLFELLGTVSRLYLSGKQEEQTFGQSWYVKKAQQYILENLSAPLQVSDIAAHLDISPGYLSHLFSALQGQTVVEYINTLRIRRIEELVLTYGLDIRQAGAQVGLYDPNYVSRLFRKIRGCTLSELRHIRHPEMNNPE